MITSTNPAREAQPRTLDIYLGFEIHEHGDASFVAIPSGWMHRDAVILEASSLPLLRMRIWNWWHRLLD